MKKKFRPRQSQKKQPGQKIVKHFGRIDVLVNNAAEQQKENNFQNITSKQLEDTFRTNIFSYFYMTKATSQWGRNH